MNVRGIRGLLLFAGACAFALGCGSTPTEAKPERKDGGVVTVPDAAVIEVPARPLGLPDLASYAWRQRGGHPAFRLARKAEAAEDWAAVATRCKQVLAADPGHLEAAYLLAAALGQLGKLDELLAPLQLAEAGDFGKWGPASLELPQFQAFLATPIGGAWRRRVERDRAAYVDALARSLIVSAHGDLYAYDVDHPRWYRVTRTFGAVIGALRVAPDKIAYVTRQRGRGKVATLAIGMIDLSKGRTSRPVELSTKGPISVAYTTAAPTPGVWIGAGPARAPTWRRFDDDFRLSSISGKHARPRGAWLEVKGKSATLHALPIPDVSADFDDKGFASAARIGKSNRIVTVPAPAVIAGNTASWSPDRARLAFVAQLDDRCAPGAVNAAAFVVDATTGQISEALAKAAEGLAVDWVSDRRLAIAGDRGVSIVDLDHVDARPFVLAGADGLVPPRHRPTCTPPDADDLPPPEEPESVPTPEAPARTEGGRGVKLVEPPPKTSKT